MYYLKKILKIMLIIFVTIGLLGILFDTTISGFPKFLLILLFLLFLTRRRRRQAIQKNKHQLLPSLTAEKIHHYEETGMSEQQIAFFRETMAQTKEQIVQLEKNMHSASKLKAIDLRNDTVKAAKAMFKELVKEPNKLHLADQFLYTHLPNLVELTDKYLEIDAHELKNKNTYDALNKSAQVINDISELLAADYQKLVADDLDELEVEMTLAQRAIRRQKESDTPIPNEEEK